MSFLFPPKSLCFNATISSRNIVDEVINSMKSYIRILFLQVNSLEVKGSHLLTSIPALQKLVNVSPDLPKLINSMNVQQPKENEIVLLSGLTSGNLQTDFEVSKVRNTGS